MSLELQGCHPHLCERPPASGRRGLWLQPLCRITATAHPHLLLGAPRSLQSSSTSKYSQAAWGLPRRCFPSCRIGVTQLRLLLGGREGSRPAQGHQLTPALTPASKTSDRTRSGTQELKPGGRSEKRQFADEDPGCRGLAASNGAPSGSLAPGTFPNTGLTTRALPLPQRPGAVPGPPRAAPQPGRPPPAGGCQHPNTLLPPRARRLPARVWEPRGDKRGRGEQRG